jgi:uncharacterized Fe-S cluster-containing radical SAM superfamily protein
MRYLGGVMFLNLNRIEFVITYSCTGNCKHCSVGDKIKKNKGHISYEKIQGVLTNIAKRFKIDSIMCFGGEPLLFHKDVEGIMNEANICNINRKQIITNGYFSKQRSVIADAVFELEQAGVTDILLSVDAFHQESIPLELVYEFAKIVSQGNAIDIKLHPAWVIDINNDNEWNNKTKQILSQFNDLEIPISNGNNIFPSGNAVKYLSDFYNKKEIDLTYKCGQAKYSTELDNVNTISIMPNGDVCVCCFPIGNVYEENIDAIIEKYNPNKIPMMKILLESGVGGLIDYAKSEDITIELSKHYSACSVCRNIVEQAINK